MKREFMTVTLPLSDIVKQLAAIPSQLHERIPPPVILSRLIDPMTVWLSHPVLRKPLSPLSDLVWKANWNSPKLDPNELALAVCKTNNALLLLVGDKAGILRKTNDQLNQVLQGTGGQMVDVVTLTPALTSLLRPMER